MRRYGVLVVIVAVVVAAAWFMRFRQAGVIVIEREPTTIFDTIRIIETTDKRHFRARNVELNRADTTQLKSIYGIGSVFARRIVEYRAKLGGYHHKEQLREVRGITDDVFQRISPNIWVDTLAIQKIRVNFASRKQLEEHPYITPRMAERLRKAVEMKGGYATLRQLLDNNILLPQEAQKIAPYVSFSQ